MMHRDCLRCVRRPRAGCNRRACSNGRLVKSHSGTSARRFSGLSCISPRPSWRVCGSFGRTSRCGVPGRPTLQYVHGLVIDRRQVVPASGLRGGQSGSAQLLHPGRVPSGGPSRLRWSVALGGAAGEATGFRSPRAPFP